MPPSVPSNLAPTGGSHLSSQSPVSPRSVSLGPQPTLSNKSSNSNNSSTQGYTSSNSNSGGATPPRRPIDLNNGGASGSGPAATAGLTPGGIGPGAGTAGATAGGKTRARDLLRRHYGLGVGPPPAKAVSNANDPMDLNSPAFDAKSYYEQLITTSTLPTLLKRENELMSEIRQLDSERQSLVYNHHHELIAASDTIGAMKAHAESLDADLDLLKAAFSEISRLSSEVSLESQSHEEARRPSSTPPRRQSLSRDRD